MNSSKGSKKSAQFVVEEIEEHNIEQVENVQETKQEVYSENIKEEAAESVETNPEDTNDINSGDAENEIDKCVYPGSEEKNEPEVEENNEQVEVPHNEAQEKITKEQVVVETIVENSGEIMEKVEIIKEEHTATTEHHKETIKVESTNQDSDIKIDQEGVNIQSAESEIRKEDLIVEEGEDIKIEEENLSQEEIERLEAIEELKATALVRTQEAVNKKNEANKLNKMEENTSEEYFARLRKSLEIYNEGVRLIDPVLSELSNFGLKNDKCYQDILTEKRNLYSNIALAHQRLKNIDEALRYNTLVRSFVLIQ
jgi:hypothetical protein